ncbi:MAG: DoxX family protein [Flavobacteriaceae bacterium]|nr:DoxX family protein [Flavobacteriaceae bacterium]
MKKVFQNYNVIWLIRYWLGIMMIYHSYTALFAGGISGFSEYLNSLNIPFSNVMAYIAKSSEFLGGLMIILNIGTRLFSGLIIAVMSVAVFIAHKGLILTEGELAFTYLLLAVVLFFHPEIPFKIFKKI